MPIIKFDEIKTGYSVDISFNLKSGLESGDLTKKYLAKHAGLKSLVIMTKFILNERNLNEVFHGGIGSYTILLMTLSFLQLHPLIQDGTVDQESSLGALWLDFLQLYGKAFENEYVAISVVDKGKYFKRNLRDRDEKDKCTLSIIDPQDSTNDVSKQSRRYYNVKKVISELFETLKLRISDVHHRFGRLKATKKWEDWSILKDIINIKASFVDKRKEIRELYSKLGWQDIGVSNRRFINYEKNNLNRETIDQTDKIKKRTLETRIGNEIAGITKQNSYQGGNQSRNDQKSDPNRQNILEREIEEVDNFYRVPLDKGFKRDRDDARFILDKRKPLVYDVDDEIIPRGFSKKQKNSNQNNINDTK